MEVPIIHQVEHLCISSVTAEAIAPPPPPAVWPHHTTTIQKAVATLALPTTAACGCAVGHMKRRKQPCMNSPSYSAATHCVGAGAYAPTAAGHIFL